VHEVLTKALERVRSPDKFVVEEGALLDHAASLPVLGSVEDRSDRIGTVAAHTDLSISGIVWNPRCMR